MIVPDFTFIATASAVLFAGALPVLVDVTPDTYCIDPVQVEAAITPRTKAIMAVHMGGHPADMDALTEIASKYDLRLVEDSLPRSRQRMARSGGWVPSGILAPSVSSKASS